MSKIPDIRAKVEEPLYKTTKAGIEMITHPQDNPYYQGNLDEEGANYLAGFDYVVEELLDNFLINLNVYQDDLDECGFDDQRLKAFDRHYAEFIEREFTETPLDLDTIDDNSIKLILTLVRCFKHWAEMDRDEQGTSLIESMDESKLEECTKKCKAGYKNLLLRLEEKKEEESKKLIQD